MQKDYNDDYDNSYSDMVPAEGRPMRASLWDYIIHGKPFEEEKPSNLIFLRILSESLSRDLSKEQLTDKMQKDDLNRITHLFFIKGCSPRLLKTNYEVLVIDATYKTNRFKMPLIDYQWSNRPTYQLLCGILLHDQGSHV